MNKKYEINFHLIDLNEKEYNEILNFVRTYKTILNIGGGEDKREEKLKTYISSIAHIDNETIYNEIVKIINE